MIAPIGDPGSPTRLRSDKVIRHVIAPAATECGYEVVRADMDPRPGMIGSQVINRLIDDDLVIADLTDHNPNVFYELAIRHAVQKPVVQIIQVGQRIPFDVIQSRTILLDHTDLDSAAECRAELVRQIRAVEDDPTLVDNPISQAIKLKALDQSPDPEERRDAQILVTLQAVNSRLESLASLVASLGGGSIGPMREGRVLDQRGLEAMEATIRTRSKGMGVDLSDEGVRRVMAELAEYWVRGTGTYLSHQDEAILRAKSEDPI